MLRALANSAQWLLADQRTLISDRFGEDDSFALELLLPVYGGMVSQARTSFRRRRVVFMRHPEAFNEIYKLSHEVSNAGSAYSFLAPYFGDESVFVMEGENHIPAKQRIYRLIKEDMEIDGDDLLFFKYSVAEQFRSGEQPVLPAIQRVASAFVIRTIFGEQGTAIADRIVTQSLGAVGKASTIYLMLPNVLRSMRRFGGGLAIRKYRLALRGFILDQLTGMDVVGDWGRQPGLSPDAARRQVVDNLMTLLIAGFETTSTTIAWLLYELARNPAIQIALRQEINDGFTTDHLAYFDADDTLLARSVLETLRLHPSIPFIIREIESEVESGAGKLVRGDYVVLSIEEMQRRYFGDKGATFEPERFRDKRAHPKIASFGGGAKVCPGRAIAVEKVRIITALIVASYHLGTCARTDGRIERNRVSATPRGGMMLNLARIT